MKTKYRYAAPFDHLEPDRDLDIPGAPLPPSPPLAHSGKPKNRSEKPKRPDSLYLDTFGDDHTLLYIVLDARWPSDEQKKLAMLVIEKRLKISDLNPADLKALDEMVLAYGGAHGKTVPTKRSKRLPVSDKGKERGRGGEKAMQPESGSSVQAVPEITGAYDWLKE